MKILTLIVSADIKQVLADTLHNLKQVSGFTFTDVEGHGAKADRDSILSARDDVVGYVPHVRVDILLESKDVVDVLEVLRKSRCGLAGRGRYWIAEVEGQGQL